MEESDKSGDFYFFYQNMFLLYNKDIFLMKFTIPIDFIKINLFVP